MLGTWPWDWGKWKHLVANSILITVKMAFSSLLLFNEGQLLKLCDFGTARNLDLTIKTSGVGTARYMAPEVIRGTPIYLCMYNTVQNRCTR